MDINSCYQLGYVLKTHGIRGEVLAFLDVDDPQYYKNLKSVFVKINESLIPFLINSISIPVQTPAFIETGRSASKGRKAILKFQNIDSIDKSKSLKGKELYLPLDYLPELEEGKFYYHQVLNYQVVDKNKGALGKIKEFYDLPSQTLMSMSYQGKEVLIPVTDAIIENTDHSAQIVHVNLPEGLVEIYIS